MPPTHRGPCEDSYSVLHESCRSAALMHWPVDRRVSELARLVSDYALCARAARLRPETVLLDLREALAPVVQGGGVQVPALIERAIADYYDARPH